MNSGISEKLGFLKGLFRGNAFVRKRLISLRRHGRYKPGDDEVVRKGTQNKSRFRGSHPNEQMSRCAAAAIGRMVRVSVVPHWTQPWVTSSSSVSGPFWPSLDRVHGGLDPRDSHAVSAERTGQQEGRSRDGATDGCRMTHTPKAYVISRLKLEKVKRNLWTHIILSHRGTSTPRGGRTCFGPRFRGLRGFPHRRTGRAACTRRRPAYQQQRSTRPPVSCSRHIAEPQMRKDRPDWTGRSIDVSHARFGNHRPRWCWNITKLFKPGRCPRVAFLFRLSPLGQ